MLQLCSILRYLFNYMTGLDFFFFWRRHFHLLSNQHWSNDLHFQLLKLLALAFGFYGCICLSFNCFCLSRV